MGDNPGHQDDETDSERPHPPTEDEDGVPISSHWDDRYISCPLCRRVLIAITDPPYDIELNRFRVNVRCPKCFEQIDHQPSYEVDLHRTRESEDYWYRWAAEQADGEENKKNEAQNEEHESIKTHCPDCDADWIVTTEKISGKAAGVGGTKERTRLTCPHCGESFIAN
jgi:transcription elongation factor Elf1